MRAWLIDGPEQLRLGEIETPEPGPTEVRVRVHGIGINRADLLQVRGMYPPPPGTDPRIPGLEYAGVVEAVGERVRLRKVGDRVMGLVPGCAYAECVLVHEAEAIPVPANIDTATAGGVPEIFLTAYRALFLVGGLQGGQSCLIRPATAGVGLAAVQLAAALGARPIGSSRDPERLAAAEEFGLVAAVADDDKLPQAVRELTGGIGVPVVLDMVGGGSERTVGALRDEGSWVLIGLFGGRETSLNLGEMLRRRLSLRAMTMRSQPLEVRIQLARIFSDRLTPLFESGRLKPLTAAEFAFEDAPKAHAAMAGNQFTGKLVLRT
jgi:NADPH2:quinone reductase